jgi:hypothetical protein
MAALIMAALLLAAITTYGNLGVTGVVEGEGQRALVGLVYGESGARLPGDLAQGGLAMKDSGGDARVAADTGYRGR